MSTPKDNCQNNTYLAKERHAKEGYHHRQDRHKSGPDNKIKSLQPGRKQQCLDHRSLFNDAFSSGGNTFYLVKYAFGIMKIG